MLSTPWQNHPKAALKYLKTHTLYLDWTLIAVFPALVVSHMQAGLVATTSAWSCAWQKDKSNLRMQTSFLFLIKNKTKQNKIFAWHTSKGITPISVLCPGHSNEQPSLPTITYTGSISSFSFLQNPTSGQQVIKKYFWKCPVFQDQFICLLACTTTASTGLAVKSRLAPGKASHGYSVWLHMPSSLLSDVWPSVSLGLHTLALSVLPPFLPLKTPSLPATGNLPHGCVYGSCLSGPGAVYREHRPSWQVNRSTQNQHYSRRACSLF